MTMLLMLKMIIIMENLIRVTTLTVVLFHETFSVERLWPQPVWPDLAIFRHFGKNFKVFGHLKNLFLVFCKLFNLLWQIFYAIGPIFIVVKCQKMKQNLAIWSQWPQLGLKEFCNIS